MWSLGISSISNGVTALENVINDQEYLKIKLIILKIYEVKTPKKKINTKKLAHEDQEWSSDRKTMVDNAFENRIFPMRSVNVNDDDNNVDYHCICDDELYLKGALTDI